MKRLRTDRLATLLALAAAAMLGRGGFACSGCVDAASADSVATATATATTATAESTLTAIRARVIHIGDGSSIDNGLVLVRDGRIVSVTAGGAVPEGARTIDLDEAHLTPGLIDANARLEPRDLAADAVATTRAPVFAMLDCGIHEKGDPCSCFGPDICRLASAHAGMEEQDLVCPLCGFPAPLGVLHDLVSGVRRDTGASGTESSAEVVPHTWVADGLNLRSPDLARLAAEGVTTVFAAPDNAAVIGPRGAVVRTAGPISERLVREAGDVHAVMGTDSFRVGGGNSPPFRQFVGVNTRRPGSRMGVAWVFRKAMYDAINDGRGLPVGGADTPPVDALPVLREVLAGEVPLRMAARAQRDIETAFRLAAEFGVRFTLVEGVEAHTTLPMLTESGTRVVFGPISMERGGWNNEADTRLSTFKDLLAAGVPAALSAQDRREEDGLARQAMYAIRSGVSPADALRAVTLTPAEILGIQDDAGSLAAGKRADLVAWSGEPFAATSRPVFVMVGGELVLYRRDGGDGGDGGGGD